MIVTRTNNSFSAQGAWTIKDEVAAQNAQMESTFPTHDKFMSDLVEAIVRKTFHKSRVFKNYRQGFIAVKVCEPTHEELISDACRMLYDMCELNKVHVVHTKTGIIFRIYRSA